MATYVNPGEQHNRNAPEQHFPAVQPNSKFTPNSVNIMSQHGPLVMVGGDSCHSGYAACVIGQTQIQRYSVCGDAGK